MSWPCWPPSSRRTTGSTFRTSGRRARIRCGICPASTRGDRPRCRTRCSRRSRSGDARVCAWSRRTSRRRVWRTGDRAVRRSSSFRGPGTKVCACGRTSIRTRPAGPTGTRSWYRAGRYRTRKRPGPRMPARPPICSISGCGTPRQRPGFEWTSRTRSGAGAGPTGSWCSSTRTKPMWA